MSDEDNVPVTILDCAVARGAKPDQDGSFTMGDIEAVGLPFFGGCQLCHASIACHNAYPSKTNYLRCRGCTSDLGFATTDEFEEWCRQFDDASDCDDDGADELYLSLEEQVELEDIQRAIDDGY